MTSARRLVFFAVLAVTPLVRADPPAAPATRSTAGKLPHVAVDVKQRTVRVDCQAVKAEYPLEFLAVVTNTNEYEAVVRTDARPSDIHLALLLVGLKAGTPIHFSESTQTWLPPVGPPVDVWFEYQKDGKTVRVPAYRWMRNVQTKKEAPPMAWVFTGSKTLEENHYAADMTGAVIGVINNELSVLDVPALKGRALESRDFERNADLMPPTGTPVTMILSPAVDDKLPDTRPTTKPLSGNELPSTRAALPGDSSDVSAKLEQIRQRWASAVRPNRDAVRKAAQAHFEVIADLRREQQHLVDQADQVQRTIDELEKEYNDLTVPQPAPGE